MTSRRILGPVNRVEGDLEIELNLDSEVVTSARVKSTMYRGFEELMVGRSAADSLILTPRICGICSVSQSVATARALASSAKIEVPKNGQLVTDILHGTEVVADLFSHFYLFFMPDFCHNSYQSRSWFNALKSQFEPVSGKQHRKAIKARARLLHIMGILGGKWPHTLTIQPGGSTKSLNLSETIQIKNILAEFKQFLCDDLFGLAIDRVIEAQTTDELIQMIQPESDAGLFLQAALDVNLAGYGTHKAGLLCFEDTLAKAGVLLPGSDQVQSFDPSLILESIDHSFYEGHTLPPQQAMHLPNTKKLAAYSWSKSPRYDHHAMETGAFARARLSGIPIASNTQANALNRMILRLHEMARWVNQLESSLSQIQAGQSFLNTQDLPTEGTGIGLVEAARGSLGHWLSYRKGKIQHYQIIAPTTWNFSPTDDRNTAGPLEQALTGINMAESPQLVQHVIRSFDPCMQCTVH